MDSRVVVYIESINYILESKDFLVRLDFPINKIDIDYFENFINQSGAEPQVENASMVELHNVRFKKGGKPRESLYYELPKELLNQEIWNQGIVVDDEDSPYLAFKVSAQNVGPLNFGKALVYSKYVQNIEKDTPSDLNEILAKFKRLAEKDNEIKLIVNNIGQGNSNEIHFASDSFVLFDFGAKNISNILPVKTKIFKRYPLHRKINQVLKKNHETFRAFVLSHWDIDHYNGLLYLDDQDLNEFQLFVVPQELPTKTSKRAFHKIERWKVLSVPMRKRTHRRSATRFQPIFKNDLFILYRGSIHYNRNKSGLTLTVHNNVSDVILSGDTHYEQITEYMYTNCSNKSLYVVIPHHGGKAGDCQNINNWTNLAEAVISVGVNQWGHPLATVIDVLEEQIGIENVHITNVENSDYEKTL